MAVIKFTNSKSSIKKIFDYITQPSKTEERLISGKDCMPESALTEMELVKNMHGKNTGRQYIHIVQSFDPKDELSYEKANAIGILLAERFTGFQAVIATHKDRNHIHNHILLNSVNFETGLKFQQSKKDMQAVKDFSDKLCLENGLSIIENPKKNTDIQRNEYQAAIKGESWKIALILTIDEAMKMSKNKEDFISNMNRFGYEVNWTDTRKNITYTTPDGKKCRDNKLHDKKYFKEEMENEFRQIEANSNRKIAATTVATAAHQPRNNQDNVDPTVKTNTGNKSAVGQQPSGNRSTQKKSIRERLEDATVKIENREAEKRLLADANNNRDSQLSTHSSNHADVIAKKKRQNDMEL